MGWFWGRSGDEPAKRPENIIDRLDPSVRQILEDEKFSAPNPAWERDQASNERADYRFNRPPPPPPAAPSAPSAPSAFSAPAPSTSTSTTADPPGVPRESLFPDGRYAHLWKTYQSYNSILGTQQTDQDRLRDLVDMHDDRKQSIGKAAVESCALEQIALSDCMRHGGLASRMMLCRTEQKRFDRCFVMQSKFLKALGYMAERGRDGAVEERLQMHADTLYHRMLEHERLVAEAEKRGEDPPALVPVMSREGMARVLASVDANANANANATATIDADTSKTTAADTDMLSDLTLPSKITASSSPSSHHSQPAPSSSLPIPTIPPLTVQDLPDNLQRELRERLNGLSAEERALEIRLFEEEVHSKQNMGYEVANIYEDERIERKARRESGRETVGDRMKRWWGWS